MFDVSFRFRTTDEIVVLLDVLLVLPRRPASPIRRLACSTRSPDRPPRRPASPIRRLACSTRRPARPPGLSRCPSRRCRSRTSPRPTWTPPPGSQPRY